jgi:hypothetical protein
MPEQEAKTVLVERDSGDQTLITCDRGAAMIMRMYEDGDSVQLSFSSETMDKICEIWLAYKGNRQQEKRG